MSRKDATERTKKANSLIKLAERQIEDKQPEQAYRTLTNANTEIKNLMKDLQNNPELYRHG